MARDLATVLDRGPVVCDGALGTMLMASGVEARCPEELSLISPETVRGVHSAYVEAGAGIITTNSFGANRFKLAKAGLPGMATEVNRAAARIAREAAGDRALVAGSMGPLGELLEPLGEISRGDAVAAFREQAEAMAEEGVDLFIVETMYDVGEATAAVEAAAATGKSVVVTMTFDSAGRTMMGVRPAQALAALREAGALVVGANCGVGPEETLVVIKEMNSADPTAWLAAQPNAGMPSVADGKTVYDVGAEEMASWSRRFLESGVRIIGSCCGSSPDHTRAIVRQIGAS